MKTANLHKGIYFALTTALISGFAIFVSKISVSVLKDPIAFTTIKNTIVALFLIGLILSQGKFKKIQKLKFSECWKLIAVGIIGGGIPFALFFTGLTMTSAVTAAFIHKTLFIWVAMLAVIFLKERLGTLPFFAILVLLGANLLLGGSSKFQFNFGELMIFSSTILWAVETMIAKMALKAVDPDLVATARMTIGSFILFVIVTWQGNVSLLFSIAPNKIVWLLIPCLFLTGYVLSWYRALKFAPATAVASILVLATPITDVLSAIFITKNFSANQFASTSLVILGVILISILAKKILPLSIQQLKAA